MNENKNIFLWRSPENYPDDLYLNYDNKTSKTNGIIFMMGEYLPYDSENIHFQETKQDPDEYDLVFNCKTRLDKLLKFDCLLHTMSGHPPIVNNKIITLLNSICPGKFQSFPIVVNNDSTKYGFSLENQYHVLNIIQKIDSINRQESYFKTVDETNKINSLKKLRFTHNCMGPVHIAREKWFTPLILVSEKLRNLFIENKITGVDFLTDEQAYDYPFPDEYLIEMYPRNPEAAKRFFVTQMNSAEDFEFFKTRVCKVPKEIMESLIEMTLARSSFHEKECAELKEIMKNCK